MVMLSVPRVTLSSNRGQAALVSIIPSLDMVIYKMSSLNSVTYDPKVTGLPLAYTLDTSRDGWKAHPFNQFSDGPVEGDTGVRRTLELVAAAASR
jgi:hypothetical protein